MHTDGALRVRGGWVQFQLGGKWWRSPEPMGCDLELRAPKNWDGPMLEGCWAAVGFVAGQRMRSLHMIVQLTGRVVGTKGHVVLVTWDQFDNDSWETAGSLEAY